jgi:hypothetical protein
MLLKILFTLAVILVVAVIFRTKSQGQKPLPPGSATDSSGGGVSSRTVIYTLLGLIISISVLIFVLHWSNQRQIINIRVTDSQGETINYQAYRKTIEGRRFTTLGGIDVTLGTNDRVEMLGQN